MSTPRAVFCLLSALRAWRAPASAALAGSGCPRGGFGTSRWMQSVLPRRHGLKNCKRFFPYGFVDRGPSPARGQTDPASADDADALQGGVFTTPRFPRRDEFLKAGFHDTPRAVFSRRASSS